MMYTPRSQRLANTMNFNATPLVDVIFLLTIFFMLVTRFSSVEQIPMQLPKPDHSQAQSAHPPARVTINCRLADSQDATFGGTLYSIGPNPPEPLAMLSNRLGALKRETPSIQAIIRADRRLPYQSVRAVMRVVAQNGISMLNVVAHVSEEG